MERQLQPFKISPKFEEEAEKKIIAFLFEAIFEPVIKEMEESKKIYFNAQDSIEKAIRSGRIQFADGIFKGNFNATLTKEFRKLGLKFDKRIKGYRKEISNLPVPLQISIAQTASSYEKLAASMIAAIGSVNFDKKLEALNVASIYEKVINNIDEDFTRTVNNVIGIQVDITQSQKEIIAQEFSENLKLFVKDFTDEQVLLLRKDVEEVVFSGIRAESLQKTIVSRFGVSQSKAKFLAKQEISLLTSKYKQAKYEDVGIRKYKWSISNVRTRPDHRALNGKEFSFDDPPVTNQDTGARNNPGEDFGCNCVAIPIVEV